MARKLKIDNALKKRFARKNKSRESQEATRQLVAYFLIVCEGEKTEPNYFKAFPRNSKKFVVDLTTIGTGSNTLSLVDRAIELRDKSEQDFDRVWVVFDKDSFKPVQFNKAILKATTNTINCAWNNESFELWYLLHFQNRTTPMSRDQYKNAIEECVNQRIGTASKKRKPEPFRYMKNSPDMYDVLQKYGDQRLAIRWAKELERNHIGENYATHNPCTLVYKLVEELNGDSATLNQEIENKYTAEI
jgi:hypothetical protein